MFLRTIIAMMLAAIAAGAGAPSTRPTTSPADPTDPANYTAADTHGDLVGVKLLGTRYNPQTGAVVVRFILGNKGNKRLVEVKGSVLQPDAMSDGGVRSSHRFTLREPVEPGKVASVDVMVGRLPSETDVEVAAAKVKVAAIDGISFTGKAEFAGGMFRDVGASDGKQ